jgi:potassium-transporting ATPase potassium-binding subunit
MSAAGLGQILAYLGLLTALAVPLGLYMSAVFEGRIRAIPGERAFLRLIRSDAAPQDWRAYATAVLGISVVSVVALYLLLRFQSRLPFNPDGFKDIGSVLALHTAASFVSSTNWQFFSGESTMSYMSQMAGLAVQTSSPRPWGSAFSSLSFEASHAVRAQGSGTSGSTSIERSSTSCCRSPS